MRKTSKFVSFLLLTITLIGCILPVTGNLVYAGEVGDHLDDEIVQVANELEELFTEGILIDGQTYSISWDYIQGRYSVDEAEAIIQFMHHSDLKGPSLIRKKWDLGSFAVCMKDKAFDDFKELFKIGTFLTLIKKKAWKEAAGFAVRWLAKNGIKRNAVATVALLNWWGVQCVGH